MTGDGARVCVLASSSGGNCSVLAVTRKGRTRIILIDAGLSPRRTRLLLREAGVDGASIDAVVVTHLDSDHWRPAWAERLGPRTYLHETHRRQGLLAGLLGGEERGFDEAVEVVDGVRIVPHVVAHDETGATSLRVEIDGLGTLGWATDVGRVKDDLVQHLRGVDVLAIESNYCRAMQEDSPRPAWLKQRIMGGFGHLSNAECALAVERIAPRRHTILLHLSRQCNTPERAAEAHAGCPTPLTISHHDRPTRWIAVASGRIEGAESLGAPVGIRLRPNG